MAFVGSLLVAAVGVFLAGHGQRPAAGLVHEGVPGHYFQMCLSWSHPDSIRRHYYDSGANEGIGFYAEEMMLQAGFLMTAHALVRLSTTSCD